MISQTLLAYLWNGGSILVEGNPTSIDMLRDLLITKQEVKAILVYQHPTDRPEVHGPDLMKVSQLNYTQLRDKRLKLLASGN